jgi:hypothetical protein
MRRMWGYQAVESQPLVASNFDVLPKYNKGHDLNIYCHNICIESFEQSCPSSGRPSQLKAEGQGFVLAMDVLKALDTQPR